MSVERICDAYAQAARKHREQTDKLGKPYLYHCHEVAGRVREYGADYEIVGVLHDVVEDTDCTLDDIETLFGKVVRAGVDAMTRRDNEEYFSEYLVRVEENSIARAVKLADARHNLERASEFDDVEKQQRFGNKYKKVIERLQRENPDTE